MKTQFILSVIASLKQKLTCNFVISEEAQKNVKLKSSRLSSNNWMSKLIY